MTQAVQRGDIEDYIAAFRDQIPSHDGSIPGRPGVRSTFLPSCAAANDDLSRAVRLARLGDLASARALAAPHAYTLIEYQDVGPSPSPGPGLGSGPARSRARARDYLLLRELPDPDSDDGVCRRNWGLYVFAKLDPRRRASYGTPLSLHAPHPLFDMHTPELAAAALVETNADSLFVAGAHRHNTPAARDPATRSSAASSDMAHNEHSLFLRLAEDVTRPATFRRGAAASSAPAAATVVQIHGFGNTDMDAGRWAYNPKRAYPQIVLSNGDAALQGRRVPVLDRLSHEFWKLAPTGAGGALQRMTTGVYNGWEFGDLAATGNVVGRRLRARGDDGGAAFIHIETDPSIRVTAGWAGVRHLDVQAERAAKYRRFGRTLRLVLAEDGPAQLIVQQKL